MVKREQKITLGEMRASGLRGLLVYCADYKCAHSVEISGDRRPDHIRLSDLEPLFVCQACGHTAPMSGPHFDSANGGRAPVQQKSVRKKTRRRKPASPISSDS
jgi:hypothetical protein